MTEEQQLDYGGAIRKLRGLTSLEALAEAAGVSPSYLSELERGLKRPSTDVVARVARALGMSPSGFLEYVEAMSGGGTEAYMMMAEEVPRRAPAALTAAPRVPAPKAQDLENPNLRLLITHARHLDEKDLKTLVDLARRLLRKDKS